MVLSIVLGATAMGTGALSATIGMAGGLVLLGVFTALLPVSTAIVLHSGTQLVANLGRTAMLWRWVQWSTVAVYLVATASVTLLLSGLSLATPPAAGVYMVLGLTALVARRLPLPAWVDAGTAPGAALAGAVCTVLQVMGGVAGPVFDVFWAHSPLDRRAIVATKSAATVVAHVGRLIWFVPLLDASLSPETLCVTAGATLVGTAIGAWILERMSAARFTRLTGQALDTIGLAYLGAAVWALR